MDSIPLSFSDMFARKRGHSLVHRFRGMFTFQKSDDMYTSSDSLLCAAGIDSGIFFSVVVSTREPVTDIYDYLLQLEVRVKNSTGQTILFLTLAKYRMD